MPRVPCPQRLHEGQAREGGMPDSVNPESRMSSASHPDDRSINKKSKVSDILPCTVTLLPWEGTTLARGGAGVAAWRPTW
jgi:hypothetical protein